MVLKLASTLTALNTHLDFAKSTPNVQLFLTKSIKQIESHFVNDLYVKLNELHA